MQILIDPDVLAQAAAWVSKTIPSRAAIPILEGVRLSCLPGEVTLATTSYEVWTTVQVDAHTEDTATVVVPGRMLADLASRLPQGKPVSLTLDGTSLRMECGSLKARLRTLPNEDYPKLPDPGQAVASLRADDLLAAARRTLPAASTEADLGQLLGLVVNLDGQGTVSLSATDRYRLSQDWVDYTPVEEEHDEPLTVLVPAAPLGVALRDLAGEVQMGFSYDESGAPSSIHLADDARHITMRLMHIENKRVVNTDSFFTKAESGETVATVDTAELIRALDITTVVDRSNHACIKMRFDEGQLAIFSADDELADSSESIGCQFTGEPGLTLGMHPRRLLGILKDHQLPLTRFTVQTVQKPLLVRGLDREGVPDHGRHIVMPVRIAGSTS